ncbi:neuronal growth regulator 1-like [Anopheles darlingi]|uniref:neuronal growth regulator 1-like n=1 Tax=Anopheles darlingi TaxID=43151 RepID=UPI0021005CA0|nr:neuronal growth regulator 1-like [Anopheles darlingi]XP_049544267.1 neuronal growth regulator 1-like [Anopheles darlingi]XP_049544269.1 neuronal growth regulator 1-like [Anopheles darlingi]XP_049544270.1 neuronal growth regulator 1-like [Anopheles darlingi]XP_049544271.1 neuronal growth regulator 1-like [Anopheles darlingi]XP_049544272.1 neuronal growth regulator 1-like [Anopheles darlingi]XP_049544273.1 neuronal growth regulator 1-like [Anopheles darlingi]XP_049544274.1 neuronal growth r
MENMKNPSNATLNPMDIVVEVARSVVKGRHTITMPTRTCCLLMVCVVFATISIKASGATPTGHFPDSNYLEEDKYSPGFLTLGQKYSIAIGSTVVLPCKINETENSSHYVLAWKRDIAVLTAGNVKVTVNPRMRLMPVQAHADQHGALSTGYNLEIRDVRTTDAGDYICQIGSMEPKEIVHTLEILVPPKIDYISPANKLDIHKGAPIRMECRASGNPTPKIIWSRKNNVMPNGEANKTGNTLEIMHANRHTSGHYKCTADNRVGQPDTREVLINVLYPPEIEVEQPVVHSGVGHEAQLVCIVHGEPTPNVIWYQDTTQIGITEQFSQQNRGNKHSLIIRNVTYSDLGNYTCQASNALGKDRGTLVLSGSPTLCYFDSPTLSSYRDQYNISWTVQSYSPIREYRLFFRLASKNLHLLHHDKPLDNHIYGDRGSSHLFNLPPYGAGGGGTAGIGVGVGVGTHGNGGGSGGGGGEQWENVVIPEMSDYYGAHNHFYNMVPPYTAYQPTVRHRMSFQLKNLKPASNYEARVQARNDHGWNKLSSIFHFSTRSEDMELEPSAQPAVHGAGLLDKSMLSSSAAPSAITAAHFHKSWTLSIFTVLITARLVPALLTATLSSVAA